jgi:hypothetical protein
MTGAIEESPPAHYDEKHLVSEELEGSSHSHQEVVDASSNEAGLHESEKEIPVRGPLIGRNLSTDYH